MRRILALFMSTLFTLACVSPNRVDAASCLSTKPTTASGYSNLIKQPIDGKWYRGDYGQSVVLPNGKSVYVFGDTIIGLKGAARASGAVHNSAILTSGACASALVGSKDASGKATDWVKVPASLDVPGVADYYWSSTPYVDGSSLRMFLLHEYNDANGFHAIGSDIATFSLSTGSPVLKSVKPTPSSRANGTPIWGAAVVRDNGYTYIYGSMNKQEYLVFGNYYYVARVANSADETITSNWQYWDGSSWASSQSSARPIVSGLEGPGTNATVYKNSTSFTLVSKRNDVFGSSLNFWTAPTAIGPWKPSPNPLVPLIPNVDAAAGEVTYLGLAHPAQKLASGKQLVSWSVNSTDPAFFGDPRYGVYFSEVTIPSN